MASPEPEKCFTCFRRMDTFIRITNEQDDLGDAISKDGNLPEEIFAKHFWFTKDQYYNKAVCTTCCDIIESFHRFYCEVENMYSMEMLIEIKAEWPEELGQGPAARMEEDEEEPGQVAVDAEALCKVEPAETITDSSEEKDDDEDEEDFAVDLKEQKGSDSESEVPLAKRKVTRKSPKQQKTSERRNRVPLSLSCQLCVDAGAVNVETFTSFYRLSKHFRAVHHSPPFVWCCNRKYISWEGLRVHFKKHSDMPNENIAKSCLECNINFNSEAGLTKHMFLIHTPEDQKQFKCDLCSKAFADQELLQVHINWHVQVHQKDHHCVECDRYFISAISLASHNEKHHQSSPVATRSDINDGGSDQLESKPEAKRWTSQDIAKKEDIIHKILTLNCSECDVVADTFHLLKKHGREAHGLKSMTVVCCERRFHKRQTLYDHCLFHLNPDAFECRICKKRFPDSAALQHHKWTIHTPASERPFKCDVCGKRFVKEYLLKVHIENHVGQERKVFQCQICDKALSSGTMLRSHMQSQHGEVSPFVCDVCAKCFYNQSTLERHRLTHTTEGLTQIKQQCTKCGKWYSNRKNLGRHWRRCGGAQSIKCDQCDYTAPHEQALKTHRKARHTERPKYPCSYCGKQFSRELRLKEHEASHAGIVLYKCDFCPKTCNSSTNMYSHKKVAHPEQWAQKMAARLAPPPPT